jgi:hypothetical protein
MTGSASTHGEKAARLRGLSEMIEGGIAKLREIHFEDMSLHRWFWPDVFRSDFPVRVYKQRIHELEDRIGQLEAEKVLVADEVERADTGREYLAP